MRRSSPSLAVHARRPAQRAAIGILLGAMLAASCLLPTACTTAKPVVRNAIPRVLIIDCSGASLSWSHCYQKAGRVCPRGYEVTQKPYKHGGGHIVGGDFLQLFGNSAEHRRMLVACRDPAPDPAAILSGRAG